MAGDGGGAGAGDGHSRYSPPPRDRRRGRSRSGSRSRERRRSSSRSRGRRPEAARPPGGDRPQAPNVPPPPAPVTEAPSVPKPAMPRPTQPARPICRHFARGFCQLGNECKFTHSTPQEQAAVAAAAGAPSKKAPSPEYMALALAALNQLAALDPQLMAELNANSADFGDADGGASAGTAAPPAPKQPTVVAPPLASPGGVAPPPPPGLPPALAAAAAAAGLSIPSSKAGGSVIPPLIGNAAAPGLPPAPPVGLAAFAQTLPGGAAAGLPPTLPAPSPGSLAAALGSLPGMPGLAGLLPTVGSSDAPGSALLPQLPGADTLLPKAPPALPRKPLRARVTAAKLFAKLANFLAEAESKAMQQAAAAAGMAGPLLPGPVGSQQQAMPNTNFVPAPPAPIYPPAQSASGMATGTVPPPPPTEPPPGSDVAASRQNTAPTGEDAESRKRQREDENSVPNWLQDLDLGRFQGKKGDKPSNWKTQLCRHFQSDSCKLGDGCNFIHEKGQLAAAKPPGAGGSSAGGNVPANNKTQLCRHFQTGFCFNGERCNFAHGQHELRTLVGGQGGQAPAAMVTAAMVTQAAREAELKLMGGQPPPPAAPVPSALAAPPSIPAAPSML
eukprot:TRINITY_DN51128_c0_g1_i1.p1 TRINITY_DN51128_c0_g1~~TRINITY_DN51128_c0_g1_i1.p1  ORF type:complete len:637 (+),score=131.38 TRINITY_DN51128_c0_g1_i1:70-1911(+)